jgi:SprT protein
MRTAIGNAGASSGEPREWVTPIGGRQRRRVVDATHRCIKAAERVLSCRLAMLPIQFDLKGRTAGMYRVFRAQQVIRFNPYLFAKYFEENLTTTVPHEVAHYVVDSVYGHGNVKPHGAEWVTTMRALGGEPAVYCEFDLTGIPVRRYRRYEYHCSCGVHELTSIRHKRIQTDRMRYFCRRCRDELVLSTL